MLVYIYILLVYVLCAGVCLHQPGHCPCLHLHLCPLHPGGVPGSQINQIRKEKAIKAIVSRDWVGLQMNSLDRLKVFNISTSGFFLFSLPFSYSIFKNGRLSGASFQHSSSNDHFYTVRTKNNTNREFV